MKEDEKQLLIAKYQEPHVTLRRLAVRLGINIKRAAYVGEKWADKGWYDYGISPLAGWLEEPGKAKAEELIGIIDGEHRWLEHIKPTKGVEGL